MLFLDIFDWILLFIICLSISINYIFIIVFYRSFIFFYMLFVGVIFSLGIFVSIINKGRNSIIFSVYSLSLQSYLLLLKTT